VSDSCWRNVKCTNERRICQSHGGYGFDECVAQAYPIDELILEDISQGSCRRTSPRWRIGRKETSFIGGLWSMYIIYLVRTNGNGHLYVSSRQYESNIRIRAENCTWTSNKQRNERGKHSWYRTI
jgi:hypothetical protein